MSYLNSLLRCTFFPAIFRPSFLVHVSKEVSGLERKLNSTGVRKREKHMPMCIDLRDIT